MDIATIITLVTILVTFVCGLIAKKVSWFKNQLIPIQNLAIGLIAGGIYYLMTGDLNLVIATVGLGTGGAYDIIHNLQKLFVKEENQNG